MEGLSPTVIELNMAVVARDKDHIEQSAKHMAI